MQDRGIVKALDLFCTKNYRFCLLHSKNTLIEQTWIRLFRVKSTVLRRKQSDLN